MSNNKTPKMHKYKKGDIVRIIAFPVCNDLYLINPDTFKRFCIEAKVQNNIKNQLIGVELTNKGYRNMYGPLAETNNMYPRYFVLLQNQIIPLENASA